MIKNFKYIALLGLSILHMRLGLAQENRITLAISDLRNTTGIFSNDRLESAIPEMLKTELSKFTGISIVERSKLQSVFKEQALSQTGVLEPDAAQKIGRILDAQYVITGELSKTGQRLRIDAHIVSVETGQVVGEKVTGPDSDTMEKVIAILAQNISQNLTGQGKRIHAQKIRDYPDRWMFFTALATGAATVAFHMRYDNNLDKYKAASKLNEFDDYHDKANTAYKVRNVFFGATLAALSAGFAFWMEGKSDDNLIMADRGVHGYWALSPYFDCKQRSFGISVAWTR